MAKEDSGRLLSKVAKFVRNPLKDWSELDADDSSTLENGYSREMLKEMIERRQRNDFVRRREFDMLRKLRQREAAGGRDPAATPSSFNVSSTSGKSDGRALTLKKIDEIEEQMSQQWWKGRDPRAAAPAAEGAPPADGSQMAEQHARAYADTVPGVPQGGVQGLQVQLPAHDGSIEEAAIRYAHGDDAGAEAILLQALAPDSQTSEHDDTWRTLLDLYRATGDAEKFVAASTRYAQRMKLAAPEWMSFRALANSARASSAAQPQPPSSVAAGEADWASPPRLAREGLIGLTRALGAAGPSWRLDWSGLDAIEPDAAGPLRALFTHWADSTVQLRFRGGDRLLLALAEATPANDRGVDAVWWQLHMAALRVMHRADEFELLALNYCITYEVSPPPWEDPKGNYASLDPDTPAPKPAAKAFSLDSDAPAPAAAGAGRGQLVGELVGESLSTWQRLDAELAEEPAPVVSCAALVRIDFAAAGTLLNWVTDHHGRGQNLQFVDAHRLVAAFFDVIGIADHASVSLRKD
ncbi:STAS domain-containing protein [Variovorax saccharolyticus]|uniref:STAS domain-containing protein n=1 Tax=Variovorax saccharolyticus TaxID=3053516 RepID=UPI00257618E2|nr:STAS domain-containing protein [Variovorax sp. J31P216]MDM0024683.1 STAS domain-containing protein [Variovorax sp. J31P216]